MSKEKQYIEGIGRRKTAIARVRIVKGASDVMINDRPLKEFFPVSRLQTAVVAPLAKTGFDKAFGLTAHVDGGGITAQAEAVRHGLARALVKFDEGLKGQLRSLGFLTRDPRAVERKKYGLKKARRAPQWSKR